MDLTTSAPSAPPIFNGSEYAHWKVRMKTHLRGLNDNVWIMVETGFVKPEGDYEKWNKDDVAKSNWNNHRLSAIFNYVSSDEFRHISNC